MAKKKDAAHGGAWKVAYADFVTAMMALFMVLWISAQDPKIVIATSQYFKNPFLAAAADATSGVLPFNNKRSSPNDGKDSGDQKEKDSQRAVKMTLLNSVAADFFRLLHLEENLAEKPIDVEITADGLRVTVFNRTDKPVFVKDTAKFTEWGTFVMRNLAWIIDHHKFRVVVEGHTRSNITFTEPDYDAWNLSCDRAVATERALTHYAVSEAQIERVTGLADTQPVPGKPRDSDSNQRITLSLSLSTRGLKDAQVVEQPARVVNPPPPTS